MTKKKSAAINGNSSPPSNTEMIKGQYGKYDSFYLSRYPPDKNNGTPFDITPHLEIVTQDENTCAHGGQCQCSMPLSIKHRCIICAFCLHPECGHELIETSVHKISSTSISLVCKTCVAGENLQKFIREDELSLSPYALNKFLRPQYPKIQLVDNANSSSDASSSSRTSNSDNSISSSSGDSTESETEDDESDNAAVAMEIKTPDAAEVEAISNEGQLKRNRKSSNNQLQEPNDDDESVVKSNKLKKNQKEKTKRSENPDQSNIQLEEKLFFMTVHLNVDKPPDNASPAEILSIMSNRLENWVRDIQGIDNTFKLHTVDPEYKTQKVLHDLKDFPKDKLMDIKAFFKGARPLPHGGKLFLRIKASFKQPTNELIGNAEWFHTAKKELFRVADIQASHVDIVGWLLYSTRGMHKEKLQSTLQDLIKEEISIRWMRINDGSPYVKNRNTLDDPRALHIECATEHTATVEKELRTIYSTAASSFPLHVRMRFVPSVNKLLDVNSLAKFKMLMNRQLGWSQQHQAKSRDDIIEIDTICNGTNLTLRDMIMAIPFETDVGITSLFASIDKKWNGQGFNFSYHPSKHAEANTTLKGLFPRLAYEYGEESIKAFFTPRAVKSGRRMKFDPQTNTVTTEADEALLDLTCIDKDMDLSPLPSNPSDGTFGNRTEVIEKERNETDSVSTFNSKRAPPSEIATAATKKAKKTKDDSSSTSTASSLSITTKHTFDSRITTLETTVDRIDSKFDLLIQTLRLSQPHTKNDTPIANPITPAKQSTPANRLASTTGNDAEAPTGALAPS